MKMRFDVELRIPGKVQYSYFHLNRVPIEVDIPAEYVVGYPERENASRIPIRADEYLTPEGLAYLDDKLTRELRNQSNTKVEINEDSVEEGW